MMLNDDAFEEELRLGFSVMDIPAPSPGLVEKTVRRYRRWRLRRRLLVAAPGVVVAASLGLTLGLSGVGSPVVSRSSNANIIHLSRHNVIHLANYVFPLPAGFHQASVATGACHAVVIFSDPQAGPDITSGSVAWTPESMAQPYSSAQIAAAANTSGGCVQMFLTVPFSPTTAQQNPYLEYSPPVPASSQVDVDGYVGWISGGGTYKGQPMTQLTVEIPAANGQMRDLGIGSIGLSTGDLLAIVSRGLS